MLYIGNDKPLAYDPLPQSGPEICLVPTSERPAALCTKEHIGLIAECAEGKVFCSSPKHLRPETCLMNNGFLMPGGIPSDMMLIEIDPGVCEPQHEIRA